MTFMMTSDRGLDARVFYSYILKATIRGQLGFTV